MDSELSGCSGGRLFRVLSPGNIVNLAAGDQVRFATGSGSRRLDAPAAGLRASGEAANYLPTALLFTAYMVPVNLLDNILRPLVMGRGLDTPMLIILIGVLGGTISYGISGLFLGPIVLAVIWQLLVAWIGERERA